MGKSFGRARPLLRFGESAGRFFSSLFGHKKAFFWCLAGLLLLIILRAYIKTFVVIAVLGVISVFSTIYKRFMRVPPAVELVTFSTVLVGIAYGPVHGAVFGAVVTLIAEIVNSGIDAFIIGYVPARAIIGFVSSFFPQANIVVLGTLMSVLYNALAQPLYAFQGDVEVRMKLLAYLAINVPFNFVIFSLFGGFAKGIIM